MQVIGCNDVLFSHALCSHLDELEAQVKHAAIICCAMELALPPHHTCVAVHHWDNVTPTRTGAQYKRLAGETPGAGHSHTFYKSNMVTFGRFLRYC